MTGHGRIAAIAFSTYEQPNSQSKAEVFNAGYGGQQIAHRDQDSEKSKRQQRAAFLTV
jgi:hypothetical protein